MNATQIKKLAATFGKVEWTDLRRGVIHIRIAVDRVVLVFVSRSNLATVAREIEDSVSAGRNLCNVKGSRYEI